MVLAVSDGGGHVMAIAGVVGDGVVGNDGVGSVGVGLGMSAVTQYGWCCQPQEVRKCCWYCIVDAVDGGAGNGGGFNQ